MRKTIIVILLISFLLSSCRLGKAAEFYAWNYPQSIESGGVVIQVARVYLAETAALAKEDEFFATDYWADKPVVVELILKVTNNAGITMNVYPDQGYAVVGGEQIDLFSAVPFDEALGGLILPGITKIGGLWFGLRRTPLEQIQKIDIVISAPADNSFNTYGSEYHFQIDLSDHKSEPMPKELE